MTEWHHIQILCKMIESLVVLHILTAQMQPSVTSETKAHTHSQFQVFAYRNVWIHGLKSGVAFVLAIQPEGWI